MINAKLYVAVAPYSDADGAAAEYDRLLAEVTGSVPNERTERELPGEWTRGDLVSGTANGFGQVLATAQQDSYLINVYFNYSSDTNFHDKYPFTMEDLGLLFEEVITDLHTAVEAELR